jgi:hypothetical protein
VYVGNKGDLIPHKYRPEDGVEEGGQEVFYPDLGEFQKVRADAQDEETAGSRNGIEYGGILHKEKLRRQEGNGALDKENG